MDVSDSPLCGDSNVVPTPTLAQSPAEAAAQLAQWRLLDAERLDHSNDWELPVPVHLGIVAFAFWVGFL